MSDYYYLNEDNTYRKCDYEEWATQWQYKCTKNTRQVIDGKLISTVWLGLDHGWFGGRPLLFETIVFDEEGTKAIIYMDRYTTCDEAIEGHEKAVQWVKDGCKED